jgi:hypothetical protein
MDQSQEALNSLRPSTGTRAGIGSIGIGIDYPELSPSALVRPPPPVATPVLSERQDSRPRRQQSHSVITTAPDKLAGRWKAGINYTNPLGWSKGQLTGAFAKLLHEMWGGDLSYLTPIDFRVIESLS